ncbi:Complex I intermediate-associated protein 30, partial [Durusdinium trenchii]
ARGRKARRRRERWGDRRAAGMSVDYSDEEFAEGWSQGSLTDDELPFDDVDEEIVSIVNKNSPPARRRGRSSALIGEPEEEGEDGDEIDPMTFEPQMFVKYWLWNLMTWKNSMYSSLALSLNVLTFMLLHYSQYTLLTLFTFLVLFQLTATSMAFHFAPVLRETGMVGRRWSATRFAESRQLMSGEEIQKVGQGLAEFSAMLMSEWEFLLTEEEDNVKIGGALTVLGIVVVLGFFMEAYQFFFTAVLFALTVPPVVILNQDLFLEMAIEVYQKLDAMMNVKSYRQRKRAENRRNRRRERLRDDSSGASVRRSQRAFRSRCSVAAQRERQTDAAARVGLGRVGSKQSRSSRASPLREDVAAEAGKMRKWIQAARSRKMFQRAEGMVLCDFRDEKERNEIGEMWKFWSDEMIGGKSTCSLTASAEEGGKAIFEGSISLEKPDEQTRVGFAAMSCYLSPFLRNVEQFDALELKVKLDGCAYQVNLVPESYILDDRFQGFLELPDESLRGKWITATLPFNLFMLKGRGVFKEEQRWFDQGILDAVGLSVASEKATDFRLEVQTIRAVVQPPAVSQDPRLFNTVN